ncbi:MAG: hypothetical protein WCW44_00920 [archaeon]|jgi:hypothetical protein
MKSLSTTLAIRRRPPVAKTSLTGPRVDVTKKAIEDLLKLREERARIIRPDKGSMGIYGAVSLLAHGADYYKAKSLNFHPNVMDAMLVAIPLMHLGIGTARYRRLINFSTRTVGNALTQELAENEELLKIVKQHKYLFIDKKGGIVATNRPRILGIGRMRLDSQKILDGTYQTLPTDRALIEELAARKFDEAFLKGMKGFSESFERLAKDLTRASQQTPPPRSNFLLAGTPSKNKRIRKVKEWLLKRKLRRNSEKRVQLIVNEKFGNYRRNTKLLKKDLQRAGYGKVGKKRRSQFVNEEVAKRQDRAEFLRAAPLERQRWKRNRTSKKSQQ